MKVRVWHDSAAVTDTIANLRLFEHPGFVELCVVDDDGEPIDGGILLRVSKTDVELFYDINAAFGFDLEDEDRLPVWDEFNNKFLRQEESPK